MHTERHRGLMHGGMGAVAAWYAATAKTRAPGVECRDGAPDHAGSGFSDDAAQVYDASAGWQNSRWHKYLRPAALPRAVVSIDRRSRPRVNQRS